MVNSSWNEKYLEMAKHISSWSKDPSRKIGAVAVGKNGNVLATGYNGFPKGIEDTEERLNNRELKHKYVVHAEQNCIYNATLNGVSLQGSTMYVYGLPVCSECAKAIIQVGVKKVVIEDKEYTEQRWIDSFKITIDIFKEANVELEYVRLQRQPMAIF